MNDDIRISDAIVEAVDGDMIERMIGGESPSDDALARIRRRTLRRAGIAGGRISRRTLRIALIAAALIGLLGTSLAVSGWGEALFERFAGHERQREQIELLGRYGTAIGKGVTRNGLRVTVEGGYANELGTMLMLSFVDEKGRLDADTDYSIRLAHAGGTFYKDVEVGEDGTVYAFLNMNTYEEIAGKKLRLNIDSLYRQRNIDAVVGHIEGARIVLDDPSSVPVDDLQIVADADAINIRGRVPEGEARIVAFDTTLRGPGGDVAYSDRAMLGRSDDAGFLHASHHPGLSAGTYDGYQVVLHYTIQDRFIEGNWPISLRMPRDAPARRVSIGRDVVASDGRAMRIEYALIARNGIRVVTSAERPEGELRSWGNATGEALRWYEAEFPDPLPRLVLAGADGTVIEPGGHASAFFNIDEARDGRFFGATVFNLDTSRETIDLCAYFDDEPEKRWVVPLNSGVEDENGGR